MTSQVPKAVKEWSEGIGGYLGTDHTYFDLAGNVVEEFPDHLGGYLVVGNYYGSAVFRIVPLGPIVGLPIIERCVWDD